ncbi:response regulator transcription factor [Clostridium estertheticum]|uniref:response regulator transcription factor n=1 Tax=Clostridium estertheticum TaxID=238834 RepID=UPI001CF16DAF|nr:response regulator transcription factor [Clostridium estertheticum]MCB2354541.1 response regulator transcription factor [Clostridium estertheticum]MCB2358467.1 response regulator transcription factor [Clostridium estertheticum]WAG40792.1 response regulator transcription factor [Clostridium estertheticum]
MKILIIEDEIELVHALAKGFNKKGYVVETATDGKEGLELCYINEYDIIILDLNLPSMDGIDVLCAIRKEDKGQKVLILSARSDVENRIKGLDMGANDFLSKPFDFGELEARVRSLLRREIIQQDVVLEYGPIKLNTQLKQVTTNAGVTVELAPKEYAILEYLMLNTDKVVSSEKLIEHIWNSEANYFTDSVKVHISNIRKKLKEACGIELIITMRGHGYLISKGEC